MDNSFLATSVTVCGVQYYKMEYLFLFLFTLCSIIGFSAGKLIYNII